MLIVGFLVWEHGRRNAMMPLSFFKIPAFSAGNAVAFSVSLGHVRDVLLPQPVHAEPVPARLHGFQAGVRFLPMTVMIVVTAPLAGRFASKHGSRAPDDVRPAAGGRRAAGALNISADTSYWVMFPMFVIMGHGMGATMAPMTAAVMNSVGPSARASARP